MQESNAETLRQFMAKAGWSQEKLAKKAGVSQPTVSRALARQAARNSRARHRLFSFIHKWRPPARGPGQGIVLQAFERIWDGSEVHANAVARIIDAMQGLKPAENGGGVEFGLMTSASRLRQRLKTFGFADPALDAAWPSWWSDDADESLSARTELRFSLARKLGLDPRSLLEDSELPRFVWRDEARFKRLRGETELEKAAITSFGSVLGAALIAGSVPRSEITSSDPKRIRDVILRSQQWVDLPNLLLSCWAIGLPVIHLRVFPMLRKRMAAMTVRRGNRHAILLAKDAVYPASIAFYLAHELAHVVLGHLTRDSALVDLDDNQLTTADADPEEAAADTFALELLTGEPSPVVLSSLTRRSTARALADAALNAADELRIEPGTLALCFGHSTNDWAVAIRAMSYIYSSARPVWEFVNGIAIRELLIDQIPDDIQPYLRAVMGNVALA